MKKLIGGFALLVVLSFVLVTTNMAATVNFVMSASVPAATGVNIVATEVNSSTNVFGKAVTSMNFGTLTYNTTNGIWLPNKYFAVDIGAAGGAGSPDVTVSYKEGAKPAGQTKGLGTKALATFVKITGPTSKQVETKLSAHGPKKLLKDIIAGEKITKTELIGGFLRVYIGIFPGDDKGLLDAGGLPFTNSDLPGKYDGTLTVTATVS